MDGWEYWNGRKVYIVLKNDRKYQGIVISVNIISNPTTFITIEDKYNNRITFNISEIELIQEEK